MSNSNKAAQMAAKWQSKYGDKAGSTGDREYNLDIVPTGSLALDYALGIGGWACGHPIEIMGPPDIGKTSSLGYAALGNAQRMGKFCAMIALEPGFDPAWAEENGVDTSQLAIGRPDNGLEAFNMLAEAVTDGAGFILFDSVGAVLRESEAEVDGKPSQFGRSSLISWGISNVLMKVWKNNVGLILLNQIRDDAKARVSGVFESPGGWALKHSSAIRVQVKLGDKPYMAKINGEDMEVGRKLVTIIKRNKLSKGSKRRAEFDYYIKETNEHPVGIDTASDIVNTAMMTGVIKKAGAYYRHKSFPEDKNGTRQFQGRKPAEEFIMDHPSVIEQLREDVLEVMIRDQGEVVNIKPTLEVVDGA